MYLSYRRELGIYAILFNAEVDVTIFKKYTKI